MPWTSSHLKWLIDTGNRIKTVDGKIVEVWEFRYQNDVTVLSAWAKHFRNHYCSDSEIDELRKGTGLDRADYLMDLIFPDCNEPPGPSIRSGDFAEILIADFLTYSLNYWVPRFRYDEKSIRNESTKGVDIIGFRFISKDESPDDILAIYEAKAKLTGKPIGNRLQDAVDDSAKDFNVRKALSLNALKRRLIRSGNHPDALKVQRFQNKADHPYHEISGAAVVFSSSTVDENVLSVTNTSKHPNINELHLLVIKGNELMTLVHELYRRAANEA